MQLKRYIASTVLITKLGTQLIVYEVLAAVTSMLSSLLFF